MVSEAHIEFVQTPAQIIYPRQTSFTANDVSVVETEISNLLSKSVIRYNVSRTWGIHLSSFCPSKEGWYYQNDFKSEISKSIGGVSAF